MFEELLVKLRALAAQVARIKGVGPSTVALINGLFKMNLELKKQLEDLGGVPPEALELVEQMGNGLQEVADLMAEAVESPGEEEPPAGEQQQEQQQES